jgi:hypothetical protein
MLVSMNQDMIKLMEIDTGNVIQQYEGHKQKQFIIRSNFGGAGENFIVSGSEGLFPLDVSSQAHTDMKMQTPKYTSGDLTASPSKRWTRILAVSTA